MRITSRVSEITVKKYLPLVLDVDQRLPLHVNILYVDVGGGDKPCPNILQQLHKLFSPNVLGNELQKDKVSVTCSFGDKPDSVQAVTILVKILGQSELTEPGADDVEAFPDDESDEDRDEEQ